MFFLKSLALSFKAKLYGKYFIVLLFFIKPPLIPPYQGENSITPSLTREGWGWVMF